MPKPNLPFLLVTTFIIAFSFHTPANSDWRGLLDQLIKSEQARSAVNNTLSNSEMVKGLKEALAQGVETSINRLGRKDGYLKDELVRILMPDTLKTVEKLARKTGQGRYIDQFITAMNRAAEQAVPQAAGILGNAIRKMSINDAQSILMGSDDAATRYFHRTSGRQLAGLLKPLVTKTTGRTGVTSAYKSLLGEVNKLGGGLLGSLIDTQSMDLDQYVTEQTMAGLFRYIAIEEKRIRKDPLARTTDIMKKVFGKG